MARRVHGAIQHLLRPCRPWHRTNTGFETDGTAQSIKYWPDENRLDADGHIQGARFVLDLAGV